MLGKSLLSSLASAVAVGGMFAATAIAGPATITAAPAIKNVACQNPNYVGGKVTQTEVTLDQYVGEFGDPNTAHVDVQSDAGTPNGRARLTVRDERNGQLKSSRTAPLDANGEADFPLPNRLRASRTYEVRAFYLPATCEYRRSAGTQYYTVMKASTNTNVNAPDKNKGQRGQANANVFAPGGPTPNGNVRFRLFKNDNQLATRMDSLNGAGNANVTFQKRNRRGQYRVVARYLGNGNFGSSQDSTTFRVS